MHTKIVNKLHILGYEAYFVGGAVRDALMGKIPKDYDIVTNARPTLIKSIFSKEKISEVGANFKVMIINGIEVATYRKDKYFGLSDKNVEISYADTLEEDLSRRDFTINAMAVDPNSTVGLLEDGKLSIIDGLTDPFNGQEDIKLRTIRFVGNAEERIYEDPCRILRALRFCCLFDGFYNIAPETYKALRKYSHLVKLIPKERIRLEIMKVMEYNNPSLFFSLLKEFNLLDYIFPSLDAGWYHFDDKHHNETVFLHNMICGNSISKRKPLLRLAGFLHDTGKPEAYNGTNYAKHDKIGAEIVRAELEALTFSTEEIDYICSLIDIHMVSINVKQKSARKLFIRLKENKLTWKDLMQLRFADSKANLKKDNINRADIKKMVLNIHKELKRKPAFAIKDICVDGHDVMNWLRVPAGPIIGKVLKYCFNAVTENPENNNRPYLLFLIRTYKED